MKVNFDTNNSYNQSFGAFKISDGALKTFKKRYMKPTDIDSFEQVVKRFTDKGDFIEGSFDSINDYLTAVITSPGRFSKTMREDTFSRLFRNPIDFFIKCADEADKIEIKLQEEIRLDKIAKGEN